MWAPHDPVKLYMKGTIIVSLSTVLVFLIHTKNLQLFGLNISMNRKDK